MFKRSGRDARAMPEQRPSQFGNYMRFLRLSAPLKSGNEALSVNELILLEEVILAWAKSTPLSVSQAIDIRQLGAQATLFVRLSKLRRLNLVQTVKSGAGTPAKHLIPTQQGAAYMTRFAEAMAMAMSIDPVESAHRHPEVVTENH